MATYSRLPTPRVVDEVDGSLSYHAKVIGSYDSLGWDINRGYGFATTICKIAPAKTSPRPTGDFDTGVITFVVIFYSPCNDLPAKYALQSCNL